MAARASGFFMNVFQTKALRWFSAINIMTPKSIPITSVSYQPVSGLNASTKLYLCQAFGNSARISRSTAMQLEERNGIDPPAAQGTIEPSIGPIAGGPPHTTYPFTESEAVMPHRLLE